MKVGVEGVLKEDLEFAGFAPILGEVEMVEREEEGALEGRERAALLRPKVLVGLGIELSKLQSVPLSVTSDPTTGNVPIFQRASPTHLKHASSTSNAYASTIAPPPGLTMAVAHPQVTSDDEDEVILFTGRQRAATQHFQRNSLIVTSPAADVATDPFSEVNGNRRSAIGSERRSSNGMSPPLPTSAGVSLLANPPAPSISSPVTASALFGSGSGIWQSINDNIDTTGSANTFAASAASTSAQAVSIPQRPSSNALFAFPNTPDAASSFGAGTDAVNTMAFLGLGSPANVRKAEQERLDGLFGGVGKEVPGPSGFSTATSGDGFTGLNGFVAPPPGIPGGFLFRVEAVGQPTLSSSLSAPPLPQQQQQQQQQQQWEGEYHFPFVGGASGTSPFVGDGWGQVTPSSTGSNSAAGDHRLSWLSPSTGLNAGPSPSVALTPGSGIWMQGGGGFGDL
ncbi:hypothetical protein HK097_006285, partial [Rhizophlyctis rosea]